MLPADSVSPRKYAQNVTVVNGECPGSGSGLLGYHEVRHSAEIMFLPFLKESTRMELASSIAAPPIHGAAEQLLVVPVSVAELCRSAICFVRGLSPTSGIAMWPPLSSLGTKGWIPALGWGLQGYSEPARTYTDNECWCASYISLPGWGRL